RRGGEVVAQGTQLPGRRHAPHPGRGDEHARGRAEGDHRRRRMPAGTAAPPQAADCAQAQERRARGAHPLRHRRGRVHRRSFLYPAVRLSVAVDQAQSQRAAHRPGRHRQPGLRRLRAVRRSGACGTAVPIVLQGRGGAEPDRLGAARRPLAPAHHRRAGRPRPRDRRSGAMTIPAPITVLVAALGGEGGGVLADWIIAAARAHDFPVQGTSVPGVAQRTGATNYYLEILPAPRAALQGREPVFSLVPYPGDVAIVAASELVEAGRMLQGGYVNPHKTVLVASTHREFAVSERAAIGDGRYLAERVLRAAEALARQTVLFDMAALAARHRTVINTVLFGAMAGS